MIKRFAIILPVFFLLSLFTPLVIYAQSFSEDENPTLPQNETIDQDYFATGDRVTLSGTVNGDAYLAGGTVFVDGTVNGDLIVVGGTIMIRGEVTEDVRAAGGTVTVSGDVGGNITVGAGTTLITDSATIGGSLVAGTGTLELFAPLGRGATFGAGVATIGSEVNGNVLAGVGEITLTNDALINGDLTYYSDANTQLNQASTASVSGSITHNIHVQDKAVDARTKGALAGFGFFLKLLSFLSALIVGLLLLHFLPLFTKRTADHIHDHFFLSLIIGLGVFLIAPILILVLFLTLIGIPFAVLFIFMLMIFLFFAKIFAAFFIGERVLSYLNQKMSPAWTFFVGLLLYGFLTAIPIFGWIISLLALFTGTGALLLEKRNIYRSMRTKKIL